MAENPSPTPPTPRRPSRWTAAPSSQVRSYRLPLRLIGIPALGIIGVFIYSGLRDYLVLPACDSARAKQTLSEVLKQLKFEPARYEPIKTVSTSKDEVVCNAVMPLPDGGNVEADYSFYWQGNKANMRYSIVRKSP